MDNPPQRRNLLARAQQSGYVGEKSAVMPLVKEEEVDYLTGGNTLTLVRKMEKQMHAAAKDLEFERAAQLRDRIKLIREKDLGIA